ncbi:hypothetical protein ACSQG1_002597 [Salmonella enterica subsp. enterica serovar Cerro]
MTTITREEQKQVLIDTANHVINRDNTSPYSENLRELARIALASLTAEPVLYAAEETLAYANMGEIHLTCLSEPMGDAVIPLYTAPLAPVSVPDERHQNLSEIYHAQEKRLFKLAQRIKGSSFDKYAHSPSQAIDVLESAIFGEREDYCRAAMLQDADGNSPVIPDGSTCKYCGGSGSFRWLQTYDWMPCPCKGCTELAAPQQEA